MTTQNWQEEYQEKFIPTDREISAGFSTDYFALENFIQQQINKAEERAKNEMKKQCSEIIAKAILDSGKYFDNDGMIPHKTVTSIHSSIKSL